MSLTSAINSSRNYSTAQTSTTTTRHKPTTSQIDMMLDPYHGEKERRRLSLVKEQCLKRSKLISHSPSAMSPSSILINNYVYSADSLPIRALFEENGDQELLFNAPVDQVIIHWGSDSSMNPLKLTSKKVVLIVSDQNMYIVPQWSTSIDLMVRFKDYQIEKLNRIEQVCVSRMRDDYITIKCDNMSLLLNTEKKTELCQVLYQAVNNLKRSLLSSESKFKVEIVDSFDYCDIEITFGNVEHHSTIANLASKVTQVGANSWIDWSNLTDKKLNIFSLSDAESDVFTLHSAFVCISENGETETIRQMLEDAHMDNLSIGEDMSMLSKQHRVDIKDTPEPLINMPSKHCTYYVELKFQIRQSIEHVRFLEKVETALKCSTYETKFDELRANPSHRFYTVRVPAKLVKSSRFSYTRVEVKLMYQNPSDLLEQELFKRSFIYNVDTKGAKRKAIKSLFSRIAPSNA